MKTQRINLRNFRLGIKTFMAQECMEALSEIRFDNQSSYGSNTDYSVKQSRPLTDLGFAFDCIPKQISGTRKRLRFNTSYSKYQPRCKIHCSETINLANSRQISTYKPSNSCNWNPAKKLNHLFGTAIFTNTGHQGPRKNKVRSRLAIDIVNDVIAKIANMDPEKKSNWQSPKLFTVSTELHNELQSFEQHVRNILGRNYKKYTFNGLEKAEIIQSDYVTIKTATDGITVLTVEMSILNFWNSFDQDIEDLYNLFSKLTDARRRRGGLMRMLGIRQMGLGDHENCEPVLLQIKPHTKYNEFLGKAALYYGKQQILENIVAPTNCKHRFAIRDMHGSHQGLQCCCAIPGFETFLGALAVSMTKDYYPELHKDRPQNGSLECILFSSHTEAVFAAYGFKKEIFITLKQPTLILLDSKRVLHGSQKTVQTAKRAIANHLKTPQTSVMPTTAAFADNTNLKKTGCLEGIQISPISKKKKMKPMQQSTKVII